VLTFLALSSLAADHAPAPARIREVCEDLRATGFPAEANPQVLDALDELQNAKFIKAGLGRWPEWQGLVDGALAEQGLPLALHAVALVESGLVADLKTPAPKGKQISMAPGDNGAGLWMFIPATARTYGLRVDSTVDERLDPVLETDAAMALLGDLYAKYDDWGLALAGYNQGDKVVDTAIREGGTRDFYELIRQDRLNDYGLLIVAAAIIMEDKSAK
jgi:membrane-bound lytic murein transglycosylase D